MSATEKLNTVLEHRRVQPDSTGTAILPIALLLLPILAFSIVQYARYGFGLFLGWDTSTYVWWAELVYSEGPLSFVLKGNYPNLYVLVLAGLGALLGSASLAERVLPFLVASPLAYAYYRLTFEMTSSRRLGYLGALMGGLTVNTLRLYSDLHRNLLSFGVSMLVGTLISSQGPLGSFSWRLEKRRALVLWLPMLAIVAYTQIETYAVLALTLTFMFFTTQTKKRATVGALLLATPIIVALPLLLQFFLTYQAGLRLLGMPPPSSSVVLGDTLLFLGGLALPWTVIGLVDIARQARRGRQNALFVTLWLLAILLLASVGILLGFPLERFLFVVPIPLITVSGVASTLRYGSESARRGFLRRFPLLHVRARILKRSVVVPSAVALLLAMTLFTSITADLFLRPYVSQTDVNRLIGTAETIHRFGYSQPVLIMYGPVAADLSPIYRAYFGIQIPDSLAYYGKLQYIFTLPDPSRVYQWQYDPSFEQASSLKYRLEILNQLGSPSAVVSRAIVIAGGETYARPLSEAFLAQFETSPGSGIFIIPPGRLTPQQIDSWRLYAYSDWNSTTRSVIANASWAQSTKILNWVDTTPKAAFEANYTISLAQSWPNMTLSLSFFDYPQPYIFPDTSSITLAPLQVYLDGNLIQQHNYSGQGGSTINANLRNVFSGIHRITIRSGSPGLGVAVGLDYIKLCPITC